MKIETGWALAIFAALTVGCGNAEQAKSQYLANGDGLFKSGRYQEAIVEFRNAIKQDPKDGAVRLKLADAFERAGNPGAAMGEYVRAADLLPADDEAQIKAATYLLLSGQFEDARTRVQPVIGRSPMNVNAQLILGNALAGLKDLDGAIREIEAAVALDPSRSTSYSALAAIRMQQGDKDLARTAYKKAVEVEPRAVTAWLGLANFQASLGEIQDAEVSLKKALEIEPQHTLANRMAVAFYTMAKRPAEAERYLKTLAQSGTTDSALRLADYYVGTRRLADARAVLAPLTKDPKTANDAETRLAGIAYAGGDHTSAHALIDAVIARAPTSVQALLVKAQMLSAEGKTTEAAQRALLATKADPNSAQAHFALGRLRDALGQRQEAMASFSEVLRLNPKAVQAQVYLSRLALLAGDVEGAVQHATGALTNAPSLPEARLSLVRGLIAKRDLGRAEQELNSLMKQFPQSAALYAAEGSLKASKNDAVGARAAFEKGLALSPGSIESLAGLTNIDLVERKVPQALARIESRVAAEPNRAELLLLAGRVYSAGGDHSKAEAVLRRAIQADPASSQAYALLAAVLFRSGRLDAARAEYEHIAEREPKNIAAQTIAAMIVQSQQKTADAKKRYETIINLDPTAAVAANNLAWIYAEEGAKLDDALRLALSAATRLPKSAEVQDTIGWIYIKKDLPGLAAPAFEKSIELDPANASYRYHLAIAYSKNGESAKARAAAQQALKLKPDYTEAQTFLAQIRG